MDAKRLILPTFFALVLGISAFAAVQPQGASAQVPVPQVPPTLSAAIRADLKAMGVDYGGDCKFDFRYLAPGKWCSTVQSLRADGAVVNYGPFATDDIRTATFVRHGEYGWKNPATGVASPERVPALHAAPGTRPDSWLITGINFAPGEEIAFFDGSGCGGEQRCPGDHRLGTTKAATDGSLEFLVSLDASARPLPGQVHRLIQGSNGSFIQVAFHHGGAAPEPTPIDPTPSAPVDPAPSQPAPNPSVGEDKESDGDSVLLFGAIAALGLVTLGTLGFVTANRKR